MVNMMAVTVVVGINFVILLLVLQYVYLIGSDEQHDDTLVMVNVIFRHGDRTIDEMTRYPKDPFTEESYYPYGVGQLTNMGKKRMFFLGKALRKRYEKFLNDTYTTNLIHARTSDYDRTKVSLMLFLSGLFPPTDILKWYDELPWNPIPYNYVKRKYDMDFSSIFTPKFQSMLHEYMNSEAYRLRIQNDTYLMEYVEKHTGKPIRNYFQLTIFTNCLITQAELGLTLPTWTKAIFPETLMANYILGYLDIVGTKEMLRMCGGYMLSTILNDTFNKIDGQLPNERKMHIHSGHDYNLICLLKLLDIFEPHPPSYAAHILMELHNIKGNYGFKIYYQTDGGEPVLQKLKGCDDTFCKLDQFVEIYKPLLPN